STLPEPTADVAAVAGGVAVVAPAAPRFAQDIAEAAAVAATLPGPLAATKAADPTGDTATTGASRLEAARPAGDGGSVAPALRAALAAVPEPTVRQERDNERVADLGVSRPADAAAGPMPAGEPRAMPVDAAMGQAPERPNGETPAREEKPAGLSPSSP